MKIIIKPLLILLLVVCAFAAGYFTNTPGKSDTSVTTSGDTEIIKHSDLKIKKDKITFTTDASGKGTIQTAISTDKIPEVIKWKTANNIITLDYSLQQHIGINYYYRYDCYIIGAGVSSEPDVKLSVGYMF